MNFSENWWVILISFIIGNLSAGLLNWIKVIQEIKKLFSKENKPQPVYIIDEKYLEHNTNVRFGFAFSEPLNWDRFDPDNNDGYKYVFPEDENIFFIVSGMHNGLEFLDTEEYANWKIDNNKNKNNFELLINRQSGRRLLDYPNDYTIARENVKAWKTKYNHKDQGLLITAIDISALYEDTTFEIYCQAPKERFEEFEDFFTEIIISFTILGENSAPFARKSKKQE